MNRISAFVFCAALTAITPQMADASDANAGRDLARKWCGACHLVAPDQDRAPTIAPTFASIGRKPGFSVDQLAKSMLAPHPQMPGRELSRDQAADIAAYIATLAK
jgi:mono/diheme cytochrome c family protein